MPKVNMTNFVQITISDKINGCQKYLSFIKRNYLHRGIKIIKLYFTKFTFTEFNVITCMDKQCRRNHFTLQLVAIRSYVYLISRLTRSSVTQF